MAYKATDNRELLRFLSDPIHETISETSVYEVRSKNVRNATPQALRQMGIGLAPEDRHREGLFLGQDMVENFLLGQNTIRDIRQSFRFSTLGIEFIEKRWPTGFDKRFKSSISVPDQSVCLCGRDVGWQSAEIAHCPSARSQPRCLVCGAPDTRGRCGRNELIHEIIMKARNTGKAILLFSSELDELIDLSDRLLIFYEGRIQAEFDRPEFEPWTLGKVMGGGSKTAEKAQSS